MNPHELKVVIKEAFDEQYVHVMSQQRSGRTYNPSARKPRMEFSKKLILGASFFYGLMCIVALMSWFLLGEWPREIIEHFSLPFAGLGISYMAKTAYENKPKIQGGDKP